MFVSDENNHCCTTNRTKLSFLALTNLRPQNQTHHRNHDQDDQNQKRPALSSRRLLLRLRQLRLAAHPITYENLAHSLLRLLRRRRHVALDVLHHLALVIDHRRQVAEHRLHLVHLRRQRQNVLVTLTDDQVVVLEICIARVHAARYEEKNRSPVEFVLHFLGI